MESELVTGSDSNNGGEDNSPPIRYTDYFEKACPYYLSIGMTWEQYWDGDNTMVKYFRQADNLRSETKNAELWLQGFATRHCSELPSITGASAMTNGSTCF